MFWKGLIVAPVVGAALWMAGGSQKAFAQGSREPAPGQLTVVGKDGKVGDLCPLEKTVVNADVSGFAARVSVTQVFHNPTKEAIEAVYTFPLPGDAAVDRMRMRIGDRVIEGLIKPKEQARRIYDAAKAQGQAAALLDQERPNIFTQSVANITPGAKVEIRIDYVQMLKFDSGTFEFSFPMVVGPRYLGNAPDPGKISPPITPKGTRTGAGIELTVNLDAGTPVQAMKSALHEIETEKLDPQRYRIRLARRDEIPNRDFILRYQVSTDKVTDAFVTHMDPDGKGGFFALAILPPKKPSAQDISPKEVFFVMDQSGSQSGFPIEKSKELTVELIKTLRPSDTFNVFGFNTSVRSLWEESKPNTTENVARAESFVRQMEAGGGTNIYEGLMAALKAKRDPRRLRIVVLNTDGFVGDEYRILDAVQKHRSDIRVFRFGIGNGVNRFLIDSMAGEGRGGAEYVTLAEEADRSVDRFISRTRTPVLTDVSMECQGFEVDSMEPAYLPDVFDQTPVYVFGRYSQPAKGKILLKGMHGGKPWSRALDVDLPMRGKSPAIASLWARNKVDSLTRQSYVGRFTGAGVDVQAEITDVALEFGIMSEYTSFVAVEQRVVNIGGKQRTVQVPVEMTDGVSYEGVGLGGAQLKSRARMAPPAMATAGAGGGAFGGGGAGGGLYRGGPPASAGKPSALPIVSADPASTAVRQETEEQRSERLFKAKVGSKLRSATKAVEIQVWLASADKATQDLLTKAGLRIALVDDKLSVVFGSCDPKALKALAQIQAVQRIEPLE